jgi:hypothetical protein
VQKEVRVPGQIGPHGLPLTEPALSLPQTWVARSTTSFSRVPPGLAPGSSPHGQGSSAMMIRRSVSSPFVPGRGRHYFGAVWLCSHRRFWGNAGFRSGLGFGSIGLLAIRSEAGHSSPLVLVPRQRGEALLIHPADQSLVWGRSTPCGAGGNRGQGEDLRVASCFEVKHQANRRAQIGLRECRQSSGRQRALYANQFFERGIEVQALCR